MWKLCRVLLVWQVLLCNSDIASKASSEDSAIAYIKGDINLGGLFPVHKRGPKDCGSLNPDRGVQRVEAMLYALDVVNNQKELLKGIKIGAEIHDTCSFYHHALRKSLQFIPIRSDNEMKNIRGVVGGSLSTVSIYVSNLMVLFDKPQISYASTSALLSNKNVHKLFARTVPSDVQQAKAMAVLVAYYNWTYVSTVKSSGSYGDPGMDAFLKEAAKLNICTAVKETIYDNNDRNAVISIVKKLEKEKDKAKVVVLFLTVDHTALLLDVMSEMKLNDTFVFVGSDGWGRESVPVKSHELVAKGALTIEIEAGDNKDFTNYFKNLTLPNKRNPWFREYWRSLAKCDEGNLTRTDGKCSEMPKERLNDILPNDFKNEAKVKFILDAVYTFAYALRELQIMICESNSEPVPRVECIQKLNDFRGEDFYKILINNTVLAKYNLSLKYDENGDGTPKYGIYNYAKSSDTNLKNYVYNKVGTYHSGVLNMELRLPVWPNDSINAVPESRCSKDCGPGSVRKYSKEVPCCWSCEKCKSNQFIVNNTCQDCLTEFWPNEAKDKCIERNRLYIAFNSWFGIIPTIVSICGIIFTLVVLVTFFIFRETPMVKASGRELSSILLAGCLICYLITFTIVSKPNLVSCTIQRIGVGLGFTCMYASMLTKTSRLARIFEAAKRTTKRPIFVSPKSQLVIVGSLIGLQVLLSAIWFLYDPPNIDKIDRKDEGLFIKCGVQYKSFMITLIYNIILIIMCTYFAIKTRTIPENFNESKYIGFTMYTTCIIWLAFLAIYFATVNNSEIQDLTLCISVSLSASVTLICMFSPKLYIILFRPDLNVRKLTMSNNNNVSQISRADPSFITFPGSSTAPNTSQ